MSNQVENLRNITQRLTDLPTLPTVVAKIAMLMQNPRTSANEVGQAITNDQSLTSKTLKLVNSAFYGFPGRISTVTHAIVILGFTTVKNIVLTASIFDAIGKKEGASQGFNIKAFWLHSIATGATAKVLAEFLKSKKTEEAFIGGLLHDLGKVILSHFARDEFEAVLQYRDEHDCLLYQAEKAILEISHQELGGWIADTWNLPKDLAAVIQYHHTPNSAGIYKEITSIIHLADILTRALGSGSGGDNRIPVVDDSVWENLKMGSLDLPKLLARAEDEIEKASIYLQEAM
ncbi:HDOD domain-containing protein [Fibrobacterota bacterium]